MGVTGSLLTYSQFRSKGFRMTPFAANKSHRYSAIFITGFLSFMFARRYAMGKIGDVDQYEWLCKNRSQIMA